MEAIQVVTLWSLSDEQLQMLQAAAPGLVVRRPDLRAGQDPLPHVRDAEVLLSPHLNFDLDQAPHLAWVQTVSAGVDGFLGHPIMASGIRLTNASGIHAVPIAEHVLAMILASSRRLLLTSRWQRAREWPPRPYDYYQATELPGATLGIVGYGSIGRHVARLAHGLGLRVLALRRSAGRAEVGGWGEPGVGDPAGEIPERIYGPSQLGEMLPLCDYVVIAVPLTPESRHLIGERELAAMKRNAFVVNISRGGLVDQQALAAALQNGTIAGAGLDVFESEPLPAESPLYQMDNVILTPHVAGGSYRHDQRLARLFADNLARYVQGQPLLNLVDPQRGY